MVLDRGSDDGGVTKSVYEALRKHCPDWGEMAEGSEQWQSVLEENPELQTAGQSMMSVPSLLV